MPKPDEKPPTPSSENKSFDDSEFFASEGITEEEEKSAIRDRARVLRYRDWRRKKEEAPDPAKPEPGSKKKKWYKTGGE